MPTVHVLGVGVVDAISGPLKEYPQPKSHPQVTTNSVQFCPGGGAVNVAATLAHLGVDVGLFTKIGDDSNGRLITDTLSGYGVDVSGVVVSDAGATPFTFVGLHPDGERTFVHTPGTNLTFSPQDTDTDLLLECTYLLYPDLHALPALDAGGAADLMAEAQRRGVITLLDECWGMGPNRATFESVARFADHVIPSLDDLLAIYPGLSPSQIGTHILESGPSSVILTMGAEGCLVCTAGRQTRIPAKSVAVTDTTGAGDSFNAGFLLGLTMARDVVGAARLGVAVAAARVQVLGASSPIGFQPGKWER